MRIWIKCEVSDGLVEGEKIVEVLTDRGTTWLTVHESNIRNGSLGVYVVLRAVRMLLVELPVETCSGDWRIWIHEDLVQADGSTTMIRRPSWMIRRPSCLPVRRNPSQSCDMVRGPCACGAWHDLSELSLDEVAVLCLRALETEEEKRS